MSQVEIHYTCILATHQLFPCNDFHPSIHFALVDSISCYIISFPNKSKQKGLWYLPRLQQSPLVYLISSTAVIHLSIHPPIHQSICCSASSPPSLSQDFGSLTALYMGQQWPSLLCPLPFCLSRTTAFSYQEFKVESA